MINFRLANVILNDSPRSDDYPDLYMRRTPAVTAHDGVTTLASPGAVRIDFAKAGALAAQHLIECGCRTLGLVYPGRHIPIAAEFYDGICSAAL